jgi:mycofactocin precursor
MTQPDQTPAVDTASAVGTDAPIDAAALIEEVSIDGMCGVY